MFPCHKNDQIHAQFTTNGLLVMIYGLVCTLEDTLSTFPLRLKYTNCSSGGLGAVAPKMFVPNEYIDCWLLLQI